MDIRKLSDEQLAKEIQNVYDQYTFISERCVGLAKFLRQCVKDSQPEGLTVEEIVKIINRHDDGDSLDDDKVDVLATAIHAAQERKGEI